MKVTALETVRDWLKTFPEFDLLSAFQFDFTDQIPGNGGIFPSGLLEISRKEDILGNVTVQNQYNFGLYYVLEKSPGDDVGALVNADWIMDFQEWVQEQSALERAPQFGSKTLYAQAQNGTLYDADEEGAATYMVQLSIVFEKRFEVI